MENHNIFKESEYNQRQFHQMLLTLDDYEKSYTDLGSLIFRLEALLGYLEQPESEWIGKFSHFVAILEEVYASTLYHAEQTKTKPILDQNSINLINQAVVHLKTLIESVRRK